MTDCTISWNVLSLAEWEERFNSIRRSNLLQCYPYAQAACVINRHRARWGLIKINGQDAGLAQVFEAGFLGLHAVILDRGPLWLPGFGAPEHQIAFLSVFDQMFPRRFGRRRRIIPEIDQSQAMLVPFQAALHIKPYQTIWIDLNQSAEDLRVQLQKNWRNALSNAERENLRVEWHSDGKGLTWLLQHHEAHRTMRNFQAASPKFIRELAKYFVPRGDMQVGQAFAGEECVAGVLFFRHGSSATYQVGWSGDAGRRANAHQLLLWQGMMKLKEQNVQDLDLGGINDIAEGVRTFKEGMGGETVTLSGIYN